MEEKSSGDETEQVCYMVQENDSLEVHSETQLDDSASSSGDDHIDADALNKMKVHLEGVNRCMANLMTNNAELKINCNTLSVTKKCSRIPGERLIGH